MPAPITSASTIRASATDASSARHIESVAPGANARAVITSNATYRGIKFFRIDW